LLEKKIVAAPRAARGARWTRTAVLDALFAQLLVLHSLAPPWVCSWGVAPSPSHFCERLEAAFF
jgi:hypothetical protein